ncbi:cupin domain-containing protein [Pararhodospirillum oryzae]|uniref:Cupin type-2 domain-containing protein n=1 Tax=Pararhodospirillum oryzae TaxID=478448 RepID=A0A512H591_9PROT|nr:cupin domain-containing protein [Pararhodospirillum oryzae]GEO80645.1 hypothetical protein ROR02_07760 [Pararhodospirillum oryzae]
MMAGGRRRSVLGAGIGLWVMLGAGLALAEETPAVQVTERLSTRVTATGKPLVLPAHDARLIVTDYVIAPGATLSVHKHPFSRYAVVMSGTLRVMVAEGGPSFDYKAGDIIVEMVDEWHYGTNTGTDPVRLIVFDQVEGDRGPTVAAPH